LYEDTANDLVYVIDTVNTGNKIKIFEDGTEVED
jgi:hypothetical protein